MGLKSRSFFKRLLSLWLSFTVFISPFLYLPKTSKAAFPKDCSVTSVGFVPLIDMGAQDYYPSASHPQRLNGGLYGNGQNSLPYDHPHMIQAQKAIEEIVPRDGSGNPSATGKIGFVSIGMSNTSKEFSSFIGIARNSGKMNDSVVLVNGAQSGQTAEYWADTNSQVWTNLANYVANAGLTASQIQVVWMKLTITAPSEESNGPFPGFVNDLRDYQAVIVKEIKNRYPNTKIVYLSSRIYAGYSTGPLSPEPFAYEGGFSNRLLIEDQINQGGVTGVTYSNSPVLLWSSYLWADGVNPNSEGLSWSCDEFTDGVHPTDAGAAKVANKLLDFFTQDYLASQWFSKNSSPSPTPTPSATPTPTQSPSPSPTPPPASGGPNDYAAYWNFDEGEGSVAADLSNNNNSLLLANGSSWSEGYLNTSLSLDGKDDYAYRNDADLSGSFPSESTDPAGAFTLSAWVKIDKGGRYNPVINKEGFRARGFDFSIDPNNKVALEVFSANFVSSVVTSSTAIPTGTWKHIAATYEYTGSTNSKVRIYIDGQLDATFDNVVGPVKTNTLPLDVGRYAWLGRYFDGSIDEVKIYPRVLSAEEINQIFSGIPPAPNTVPVAYDQAPTVNEDTPTPITLTASDAENDPLTYEVVEFPLHGALEGFAPALNYTPEKDFTGYDSFTFRVFDGKDYSNIASVSIYVSPVNDAPYAVLSANPTSGEVPLMVSFDAGGSYDIDGVVFRYLWDFGDGSVSTESQAVHTYNNVGEYVVTLTIEDDEGALGTDSATISVFAANYPPLASDINSTTNEDESVDITLLATDVDNDSLNYHIVAQPQNGSVSLSSNIATYRPFDNYFGPDSFTYVADDGKEQSNIATVFIEVLSVNDAPIVNISASPQSGIAPLNVAFDASGSYDIDGSITDYSWDFGDGTGGTGSLINHEYVQNGSFTAVLTVTDNQAGTAKAQVQILVSSQIEGLVAEWKFDEGGGTTAFDSAGFGNSLSLINSGWSSGFLGYSINLNGSDSYGYIDDSLLSSDFPTKLSGSVEDFTISAYLKRNSSGRRHTIVSKQNQKYNGFSISVGSSNKLEATVANGLQSTGLSSLTSINSGEWYHVAVTYDYIADGNSILRLYVNGILEAETLSAVGPVGKNSGMFLVGKHQNLGAYFPGQIDELKVFSRQLSSDEVALLVN